MKIENIRVGQILRINRDRPHNSFFMTNDIVKIIAFWTIPPHSDSNIDYELIKRPSDSDYKPREKTNYVRAEHLETMCKLHRSLR